MWLFTRYGFLSVVCAKDDKGASLIDLLMVRARTQHHLRNLQIAFPELTGKIHETMNTDYQFRIMVPKRVWQSVMAQLVDEQEWSNFKEEAGRFSKYRDKEYLDVLHEVWGIVAQLQHPVKKLRR